MFRALASSRRLPAAVLSLFASVLIGALAPSVARAQSPGELDTSFTSVSLGSTFYALTLERVRSTDVVFLGGDFDAINELTTTGADYGGFNPESAIDGFGNILTRIVYTSVPEIVPYTALGEGTGEHKLLVGGLFGRNATQVANKQSAQNIIRLLPDGTIDTTFNPGRGADNYVTAILPLADGGMVVGGLFEQFNAQNHGHIVRLDNTGAVVSSSVFNPSLAFDDTVLTLAAQVNPDAAGPQGQILVGGTFSNVGGQSHGKLARLNADGSVDTSFNPNFSDRVTIVVSQPDGKILVGGYFNAVSGTAVKHLVRLNYDGSVDTTFNAQVTTQPPLTAASPAVNTITPVGDGRYYIGGNFAEVNGVARRYLARVNADGSVDDFDPGLVITNAVQNVAVDYLNNRVYVAETRSKSVNNVYPPSLIRLYGDPVPLQSVTITASVPIAASKTSPGLFKLTRSGLDLTQDLHVYVSRGGTGNEKNADSTKTDPPDYKLSPSLPRVGNFGSQKGFEVTIPANSASVSVVVVPTKKVRAGRTVVLTVQPDVDGVVNYAVGASSTATVTLE